MGIKKNVSNAIVFASVFVGTIVGAGIAFITSSAVGTRVRGRLQNTAKKIENDVTDQVQTISVKVVEKTAELEHMAKTQMNEIKALAKEVEKNFKDSFEAEKKKISG